MNENIKQKLRETLPKLSQLSLIFQQESNPYYRTPALNLLITKKYISDALKGNKAEEEQDSENAAEEAFSELCINDALVTINSELLDLVNNKTSVSGTSVKNLTNSLRSLLDGTYMVSGGQPPPPRLDLGKN